MKAQDRIYPSRVNDPALREELRKLQDLPNRVAYLLKMVEKGHSRQNQGEALYRDPSTPQYARRSLGTPVARTGPDVPKRDLDETISGLWTFLQNLVTTDVTLTTLTQATTPGTLANQEVIDSDGGATWFYRTEYLTAAPLTYNAARLPRLIVAGGAGGYSIVLPPVATVKGRILTVKNRSSGSITVDGNGAETIDGSATDVLTSSGNAVTIAAIDSSGDDWVKLSEM